MSGNGVPTGIAITVLAYELFDVKKTYDSYGKKNVYDDFDALRTFVQKLNKKFVLSYCSDLSFPFCSGQSSA